MAGFRYAYSMLSDEPLVIDITTADTTLNVGDLVNLESGDGGLAVTNDSALVGVVLGPSSATGSLTGMTASTTKIRVIANNDAVYAVADANARTIGDTLDISGATGAQTVAASSNADFVVVADSTNTEETLVRIKAGESWMD